MKSLTIALTILLTSFVSFGQNAIQVEKSGKGEIIIFLPGFTNPGTVWNETIKNIQSEHENHVVSYAGFDGMAPISTPWYEPIKNALVTYVKNNELTNVTIVGHSMGGNLAIDLAAELPNEITALILIESIPCMRELMMPGVPASAMQYDSPYNNQALHMTDHAFKQMALGMSQNMTNDQAKVELLANWMIKADRKTYVYGYTDLLKLDLRDKLTTIKAKTLILGASFPSKSITLSNYEKQYENLTTKEILIADDSKHFIMFDQPEWLYNNINNFLGQNE